MVTKRLGSLIASKDKFVVVAEFVPLPGHRLDNFRQFLGDYPNKKNSLPDDVVLAGVTIPQSPGGVTSMSPLDIFAILNKESLWSDLDVIAHVTAKDHNLDAIRSYLLGLNQMGLESVLALTGDKPAESKGVFEVDSIGLIELITEMNDEALQKAAPGKFDQVRQFYIAAGVSQYKYTEASQMQQYYKMAKKIRAGAHCLITQLGWDWRKSQELFTYLHEEEIDVPVIGNVYVLTTMTPAPRLMHEGKLPGCVVTKELFEKLRCEKVPQQLERAAQQVAMYRAMGAAGVDLGGLADFDMLLTIMNRAKEIGSNWTEYKENLSFGPKTSADGQKPFYLYRDNGVRVPLSSPKATCGKKTFDLAHKFLLTEGRGLHGCLRKCLGFSKSIRQGKGFLYKLFFAGFEAPWKKMLFECKECGDCFLPENFGICSIGKCEKGLDNPPCGDANPDGTCGNNLDIRCVGELIYNAAASEGQAGLQKLARQMNPKRNPALEGTASIPNYLLGRDHTARPKLIQIGESVHASIPKPGAAMKELLEMGHGAYDKPSGPLNYIISLITSQIRHRADYIEINVDAFGEDSQQTSIDMMRDYVRLVRKYGQGVPVCIDSSNDDVLKAGLEQWYQDAPAAIAKPLLNSVKVYTIDTMLPLNNKYPFKVIGLLIDDKADASGGSVKPEALYNMARKIFNAATGKYRFLPDDIFFDTTVFPLAIDMPMMPDTPGYTYCAFEAIKKVMNDPAMKGVHTSLGISNCVKDLPGRSIGVCRAYLAKAQEYGLDAGIVNVMHDYGLKPVADDLLELVDAFAKQDGTAPANEKAMSLMGNFCRANKKIAR